MISSNLVKLYYTDNFYESGDVKSIVGVILQRDHSSVTLGVIDRQILLNWHHVIKIESINNKRGPPWNIDFRKM